jgi:hypothetical protein
MCQINVELTGGRKRVDCICQLHGMLPVAVTGSEEGADFGPYRKEIDLIPLP